MKKVIIIVGCIVAALASLYAALCMNKLFNKKYITLCVSDERPL